MKIFLTLAVVFLLLLGRVAAAGDSVEISDPSDILELREHVGDVRETITEVELDMLHGGQVSTAQGTTEYNQYLRFRNTVTGTNTLSFDPVVDFTENDAPTSEVGDFLVVREGSPGSGQAFANESFFEYELEFEDGLESAVVTNTLPDYRGIEIPLVGVPYGFVKTFIDTSLNTVALTLVSDPHRLLMEENTTQDVVYEGTPYHIEVLVIQTVPTVTMTVNGELFSELGEGDVRMLADGRVLGIVNIIPNALTGDLVEFYLGTSSLQLIDNDYRDSDTWAGAGANLGYTQSVFINGQFINRAFVQVQGNEISTNLFEIFTLKYRLVADALPGVRDVYAPPGHGVREFLQQPEGMLGFTWDIRYEGLEDPGESIIKLDPAGDDEYNLELENRQGLVYRWPFVTNEGGTFKYGDNNDDFVFIEGYVDPQANLTKNQFNIGRLDYFILSDMDRDLDDTAFSHILRYNSIDTAGREIMLDDLAVGSKSFVYNSSNIVGVLGEADIVVGGNTYRAYIANMTIAGENPLAIDMEGDGNITARREIRFTTNGGAIIDFGERPEASDGANVTQSNPYAAASVGAGHTIGGTTSAITVNITTLSENFDENSPPSTGQTTAANEHLSFKIQQRSSNRIGVSTAASNWTSNGGFKLVQADMNDNNFEGMTDYGMYVNIFDPDGTDDAETVTMEYPLLQREAHVFVVGNQTVSFEDCTDGIDNDGDGLIDCQDPDCSSHPVCQGGGPEICDNNIDDDNDNQIDCNDILDCGGFCIQQLQQDNAQLRQKIGELEQRVTGIHRTMEIIKEKVRKLWCAVFECPSEPEFRM